ncbi:MAG: ABC transporter permease [Oscillospiraceae bacterium]|nr:ABC transporter permease [Oscillospiraceae bacterium]MDY4586718.1 ABC transporter permease [Oscillospiraceae bacterium]
MKNKKLGFGSVLFMTAVYLFLYLPIFVVILYSFNTNRSNISFNGYTLYWYKQVLQGDPLWGNLWLSVKLALVSMVISVGLGTLATIGMYRYDFKIKKYINGLLYIPMVIPELVIGLASLAAFTKMGMNMGFATLVFAHVTFCLPYVVVTLRARISDFDSSIEEAAMDLGADRWHTLKRVTLPLLAPGIISGAFMSISLSIDDVIISYFVSGAGDITFPIKVYGMVRGKISTNVYVVSTLFLVSIILIYLIGKGIGKLVERKMAN